MAAERADLALPEHHEELRASRTDCSAACSDAGSAGPNSIPTSTGQAAEALHRADQHDAAAGAQHNNAAAVPGGISRNGPLQYDRGEILQQSERDRQPNAPTS